MKKMSWTDISSHEGAEKNDDNNFFGNIKPRGHGGNLWNEWRLIFIDGRMGEYYWNAS
jgi:hypothetical protein